MTYNSEEKIIVSLTLFTLTAPLVALWLLREGIGSSIYPLRDFCDACIALRGPVNQWP